MTNPVDIQKRIASLKALAEGMLKEAINMEKELGLVEGSPPRKGGLSDKQLAELRVKRSLRLTRANAVKLKN